MSPAYAETGTPFWQVLPDAVTRAVIFAVFLVVLSLLVRLITAGYYRLRQRGLRPMVVTPATFGDGQAATNDGTAELAARLLAYVSQATDGDCIITPGTSNLVARAVPAEAPTSSAGWVTALTALGFAREPSYVVRLTPYADGGDRRVVVHITTQPGQGVVASKTFDIDAPDDPIADMGAFCLTHVRNEPRQRRRTARWEQWGRTGEGYAEYRRALRTQGRAEAAIGLWVTSVTRGFLSAKRSGPTTTPEDAHRRFQLAAQLEPNNITIRLTEAALYERENKHGAAADIYQACTDLWPRHVEALYRRSVARHHADVTVYQDVIDDRTYPLARVLRRRALLGQWLLTFRPRYRNLGERAYWSRWLFRGPLPVGGLDRRRYLTAERTSRPARVVAALVCKQETVPDALTEAEKKTARQAFRQIRGTFTRSNAGWMAHYNAACFYSWALRLGPGPLSDLTQEKCDEQGIEHLKQVFRDPGSELDPEWLINDQDLHHLLWETPLGRQWLRYLGVRGTDVEKPGGEAAA